MMNAEEEEYMDYLIHNRRQLTNQNTKLLDEIEVLQNRLEVSEKEHYKTLQQLAIATKALREYANEENWRTATTIINTDYFEFECSMYGLKDSGFEEAQKALKEIELVGTSAKEEQ